MIILRAEPEYTGDVKTIKLNIVSERDNEMLDIQEHADLEHEIWASWMRYMFSCGHYNEDGSWTMPVEKVERWKRQMETQYRDLTENECKSDIEQVQKHITLIERGIINRLGGTSPLQVE